jgi:hypothetical protein
MNLGPRETPRLRLRRLRSVVPRRRVVVLLLLAFCMIAACLLAADRFTSGSVTVGVGEIVILALSPTLAFGMGCSAKRGVRAARRWTRRRRDERAMRPTNPPIEEIAADLRRMLRTHDGVVRTRHIATTDRRVPALDAAIRTSAVQAARALEVSHPNQLRTAGWRSRSCASCCRISEPRAWRCRPTWG